MASLLVNDCPAWGREGSRLLREVARFWFSALGGYDPCCRDNGGGTVILETNGMMERGVVSGKLSERRCVYVNNGVQDSHPEVTGPHSQRRAWQAGRQDDDAMWSKQSNEGAKRTRLRLNGVRNGSLASPSLALVPAF